MNVERVENHPCFSRDGGGGVVEFPVRMRIMQNAHRALHTHPTRTATTRVSFAQFIHELARQVDGHAMLVNTHVFSQRNKSILFY